MKFLITIHGPVPEGIADRIWRQIEWAGVNFTVLDKSAFIYGNCEERVINQIAVEAGRTGHFVEVERGQNL